MPTYKTPFSKQATNYTYRGYYNRWGRMGEITNWLSYKRKCPYSRYSIMYSYLKWRNTISSIHKYFKTNSY